MTTEEKTMKETLEDSSILMAVMTIEKRSHINLEPLLSEISEYFDNRADVRDGPEGEQLPNEAMVLGQQVDQILFSLRKALGMKTEF